MIKIDFVKSALTKDGFYLKNDQILKWLYDRRNAIKVNIQKIKFSELVNWGFEKETHNLVHSSGKFFSIEGIKVNTNWGSALEWTQPIINQPEIGYLGILTKKIDGVLHFLMQAKIEPGNINYVQLSPTLQATKSNYTQVHKGNPPNYLEYFRNRTSSSVVLLDQLQSEQGARFLRKRNRNIILETNEEIEIKEDFCWLTLGQIHHFLGYDNVINMDTRTVISGIPFGNYSRDTINLYEAITPMHSQDLEFSSGMFLSAIENDNHKYSFEEIISWITELKSKYELTVDRIPINELKDWNISETKISHKDGKYFNIIPVHAEIENREVSAWTQPLVESVQEGIIAFVVKKFKGVFHFLVQAKLEAGNLDIIELAPTVQCLTGNYRKGMNEYEVPFLDYVLENMDSDKVKYNTYQSEEGGRFYREQNKNLIIDAGDDFSEDLPENYCWITLNQLKTFIQFNNYLNIQARSLISAIKFI